MAKEKKTDGGTATAEPEKPGKNGKPKIDYEAKLDRVKRRRQAVRRAKAHTERKKSELKQAKSEEEVAVFQLLQEIDDSDQQELPFKSKGPDDESWKEITIREALKIRAKDGDELVPLPDGYYDALEAAEIRTLGEYSAFCNAHPNDAQPLATIKGIGETKAETIRTAEALFWERWGSQKEAGAATATEGDVEDEEGDDDDQDDEE